MSKHIAIAKASLRQIRLMRSASGYLVVGLLSCAPVLTASGPAWPQVSDALERELGEPLIPNGRPGTPPTPQPESSGTGFTVRGIKVTPVMEIGGGFDSNVDGQSDADETSFGRLNFGSDFTRTSGPQTTTLSLNATGFEYFALDLAPSRFEVDARLEWERKLSDSDRLKAETGFIRDALSIDRSDILESRLEWRRKSDAVRAWARGVSFTQLDRGSADERDGLMAPPGMPPGDFAGDVFDTARETRPDYTKTWAEVGYIPRPEALITWFAISQVARATYFNQDPQSMFDRRANEVHGIAGVRVNFSKDLRVDAGWRLNHRTFADLVVPDATTDGLDLRVSWTPSSQFGVRLKATRAFEETTSRFAIADDVETYEAEVSWKPTKKLEFEFQAKYEIERPVADVVEFNEFEVEATATYALTNRVDLFAEGLYEYVEEKNFGDNFERYKAATGVRLRY